MNRFDINQKRNREPAGFSVDVWAGILIPRRKKGKEELSESTV